MKILMTGASSFTGLFFAEALVKRGHTVTAFLRGKRDQYEGIRKKRVERLATSVNIIDDCTFGSDRTFLSLNETGPFELVCFHAAEVSDYKSPDFDFAKALQSNTYRLAPFLKALKQQGCNKLLLSGSVFEPREGFSSDGGGAISPYGLSKGLTSDVYRYFASLYGFTLGKFVIPNPFGPLEENRFTGYLANLWLQNKVATVSFPDYVRDNIPVSLLAESYATFAESLTSSALYCKLSPSFRPSPQSYFVQQFADHLKTRFLLPCEFSLAVQNEFPEPQVRINSDRIDSQALNWDETAFWDELADFYLETFDRVR